VIIVPSSFSRNVLESHGLIEVSLKIIILLESFIRRIPNLIHVCTNTFSDNSMHLLLLKKITTREIMNVSADDTDDDLLQFLSSLVTARGCDDKELCDA